MLRRTLATPHPIFGNYSIPGAFLLVALVELGDVGRVPVHDEALQQDLVETVWDIREIRDNDQLTAGI
jgi:hypothetical protein